MNMLWRDTKTMYALFHDLPRAVAATSEIAARCRASLPHRLQVLPVFPTPDGISADAYLRRLCADYLVEYFPGRLAEASALLEKELDIIHILALANYFLIVWDIVAYCRRESILCHGRGSAATSIVANLLSISAVDPLAQGLVVERVQTNFKLGDHSLDETYEIHLRNRKKDTAVEICVPERLFR